MSSRFLVSALMLVLAAAPFLTHAQLTRAEEDRMRANTGLKNSATLLNFPTHYIDVNGFKAELCMPRDDGELDNRCLFTSADISYGSMPLNLGMQGIPDEYFYYMAEASVDFGQGSSAMVTLALESAFANGVAEGEQVVFGRLRLRLKNCPAQGMYLFHTPYGTYEIECEAAGERIFFTQDIGINCCPNQHWCAHKSHVLKYGFVLPATRCGVSNAPVQLLKREKPFFDTGAPTCITGVSAAAPFTHFKPDGTLICERKEMFGVFGPGMPRSECTDQFSMMGKVAQDSTYKGATVFETPDVPDPSDNTAYASVLYPTINYGQPKTFLLKILAEPMPERIRWVDIQQTTAPLSIGGVSVTPVHATSQDVVVSINALPGPNPVVLTFTFRTGREGQLDHKNDVREGTLTITLNPKEIIPTVAGSYKLRDDRLRFAGTSNILTPHSITCEAYRVGLTVPIGRYELPVVAGAFSLDCRAARCMSPIPVADRTGTFPETTFRCTSGYDSMWSGTFTINIIR